MAAQRRDEDAHRTTAPELDGAHLRARYSGLASGKTLATRRGAGLLLWACIAAAALCSAAALHETVTKTVGNFQVTVGPITTYYACSADTSMYPSEEDCSAACRAGECTEQYEKGDLTAAQPLSGGGGHSTTLLPSLRVNQELQLMVSSTGGSAVELKADPGAPIGMRSEQVTFEGRPALQLRWAPVAGLEGYVHDVHIAVPGIDDTLVVRIPVLAHALSWVAPTEHLSHVHVDIGASTEVQLQCLSTYTVHIMRNTSVALPHGVAMTGGHRLRQTDGNGAVLPYPIVEAALSFSPVRGQEGFEATVCVTCKSPDVAGEAERCVMFHGAPCRYVSKPGDSLLSLTRMFHRDNNWRRMLNLNALQPDASHALPAGTVILTGALYDVQPGDSLTNVAARFHTTVRTILELNPVVASADDVRAGDALCLAPCTARGNPSLDLTFAY